MEKFVESLLPVLVQIGAVLGFAALVYIAKLAKDYMVASLGKAKLEEILKKAEVYVQWAEQTMENAQGFEKKEAVLVALKLLADALGYVLSDLEADQIVEAQVFKMNLEKWPGEAAE